MIQRLRVMKLYGPYDEETKTIPTNFNEKKAHVKCKVLLAILLTNIILLIAVSIYCYLIKHQAR